MVRYLAAALVVLADTLLFAATHQPVAVLVYVPAAALLAFTRRAPLVVFAATLGLAVLSGGSYPLLVWISYRTGLATVSRRDTAVVAGAVTGWSAMTFALETLPRAVASCVVFVVLPLLVGRYLAQHRRLVAALESHNRQLRRERELLAEREQLRERLRIARDMHDSLGHRLSLVSVQAAALEVGTLPAPQRAAVESLASATRAAVTELYELIGSLRRAADEPAPGMAAIDAVITEFRAAGVPVTVETDGVARPLPAAADTAAYRVVEEGLTNAAKHAPGEPVAVRLVWEPDALVLSVVNAVGRTGGDAGGSDAGGSDASGSNASGGNPSGGNAAGSNPSGGNPSGGLGLVGLRERVEPAGGFLDHRETDGRFRLVAMLPTIAVEEPTREPVIGRVRATALGAATAALLFFLLPASLLVGVS